MYESSTMQDDAKLSRGSEGGPAQEIQLVEWDADSQRLAQATAHPGHDLRWLGILSRSMGHRPYLVRAVGRDEEPLGHLPLAYVSSWLFGRYLVSLPYINTSGVVADDPEVAGALIERAARLADELDCRFLELRHETSWQHSRIDNELTSKVHMRLSLPETSEDLMDGFKSKFRSQLKKGLREPFAPEWGREELLAEFYAIFSRRMRDLGTPVYSRRLFREILEAFGDDAEICCLREGSQAVAAALLVHGTEVTEVPSAAALTEYNPRNANMVMYWHLLCRAIERRQGCFDFGRSTRDAGTYRFKKQWGAEEHPAVWQYYVRSGDADALRPDSARNQKLIAIWKRLPLWLTRVVGPWVVRGIP